MISRLLFPYLVEIYSDFIRYHCGKVTMLKIVESFYSHNRPHKEALYFVEAQSLKTLQRMGAIESSRIVFFGGAGVSTESGIPDFRSVDGLYHQHYSEPPETILSHSYFVTQSGGIFPFLPG